METLFSRRTGWNESKLSISAFRRRNNRRSCISRADRSLVDLRILSLFGKCCRFSTSPAAWSWIDLCHRLFCSPWSREDLPEGSTVSQPRRPYRLWDSWNSELCCLSLRCILSTVAIGAIKRFVVFSMNEFRSGKILCTCRNFCLELARKYDKLFINAIFTRKKKHFWERFNQILSF